VEPVILFTSLILVVALIGTIRWWWSEALRVRRALAAIPPVPVASLKNAEVARVRGVLRYHGDAVLASPIGQRPCAAYRVDVRMGQGLFSRKRTSCEAHSFLVEDASGTARVSPARYTLDLRTSDHVTFDLMTDPPAHAENWLRSKGMDATNMFGISRSIECKEGVLAEGQTVTVLGRVEFEYIDDPSAAEGYRDRPRRAVIVSPLGSTLKISNHASVAGRVSGVRAALRALLVRR